MFEKHYKSTVDLAEMLNDASIDRVIAIDRDYRIIAWNKMAETLSGIKKQEALNRHLMEVFPKITNDIEMLTAFEFALSGEKSYLPAKEEVFNRSHYENHFIPLQDNEEHIIGVMNITHDVADRIKVERQLKQANAELKVKYRQLEKAKAELAAFTAITGNELEVPIKKVYTALELIMIHDGSRLSDSSKAGLRRMQASLNRVKLLLDDILAISTAGSVNTNYTTVDLNHVAGTAQESLLNKIKESKALIDIQPLPSITGSEQMLHNLFFNLLDNAIKFHYPGNTPVITISATIIPSRKSMMLINNEKPYVCIHFADNGIGFNQANAEKIFNMFERLHPRSAFPGSGIGLTICRKIVEAHGGYIEAEGQPGKGATFMCYLPITPTP